MRVLLDTHLLLWATAMSSRLPLRARELLEDASNEVYCSAASVCVFRPKLTAHSD